MFKQLQNIDTAFRHVKSFSIAFLLANVLVLCFGIFSFCRTLRQQSQQVYILYNGKLLSALAAGRDVYLPVELRDHISTFHEYFFNLIPEDKAIRATVSKSLYLADQSAKKQYDNLRESGYYNNLISANISRQLTVDSIQLGLDSYPYYFRCFATEKLIRSSSTVLRRLVTQGQIRDLKVKTEDNPHGFLIQNWEILENNDLPLKP